MSPYKVLAALETRTKLSPPGPADPPASEKWQGTVTRRSRPTPTPRETYKLGAFLSRPLGAAGRRGVLGALPARHPAVLAAAERGGGGVGSPGGGALRRVVQPWPVPIHLPRSSGDGQRRPLSGSGERSLRTLRYWVPPPRSAGRTSPTAAAGTAAANTSENSRHRGRRGNPPIRRREVTDPPRTRPFRAQRHTIGCAVRSFAHSALRRVLAQRVRLGAELGWSAERLPAVTCLVGLEVGGPGPSNPESRRDPLRPATGAALECEKLC